MSDPLYPYQETARRTIAASGLPVVNAFEPGLGKTRVALELLRGRGCKRILVVCPASALLVWQKEVERWWEDAPPVTILSSRGWPAWDGIYLLSYGLLSGRSFTGIAAASFDATILDECHFLKNPRSNRSLRLFGMLERRQLGWVHAMSGTPAPNHAGELWPLMHYLRPDLLKLNGRSMTEVEYFRRYTNVRHFKVNGHWVEQITGSKNLGELRQRMEPMFVIVRKRDVLPELPPLDFVVLPVAAPQCWVVPDNIPGALDDDAFLAAVSRLSVGTLQQIGLDKVDAVIEWICDLLDNNPGRRLCLWALHHAVIDVYARRLKQYGVAKFDGRDGLADRRYAVDRFMAGKARIFLGQIMAGGTALTLVSRSARCRDVVFAEASFSPANNYQAACRVHRIGQQDGVLARYAAAAGTLDDRVQEILARKSREIVELFG